MLSMVNKNFFASQPHDLDPPPTSATREQTKPVELEIRKRWPALRKECAMPKNFGYSVLSMRPLDNKGKVRT